MIPTNRSICSSDTARASAPSRRRAYQSTVHSIASSSVSRGTTPSRSRAFDASSLSTDASCGPLGGSAAQASGAPHRRAISATTHATGRTSVSAGPKFHSEENSFGSRASCSASLRYPASGSRTCCHGRSASGFRTRMISPCSSARTQSGTNRSSAQSPPPMTLPARTVATPTSSKNDFRQAAVTSSAHALLALYGSWPPSGSDSRYGRVHSRFS